MTDTLDAIRARDAADITITLDWTGADWRRALWQVAADRRTLLGMLEPSAVPEHEPCCACCSEVDRLTPPSGIASGVGAPTDGLNAAHIRSAERHAIAAAIRALPYEHSTDNCVDREAVLSFVLGPKGKR